MTKHEKALKFMHDNLGQHEVPMGSNTGTFVLSCQRATWLGGTRWPWCCATIIKAWTVAGLPVPWRGAGAYALLDWYRSHLPKCVVPLSKARTGSAVIFNIGSGHVAMLAKPYSETEPNVVTIGGNEGDAVREVTRRATEVRGVVDPAELGTVAPAKPPKVFEVVGSVSGHKKIVFVSGAKGVSKKLPQLLNHFGGVTIRRRKKK
jgi:hypothetical protein